MDILAADQTQAFQMQFPESKWYHAVIIAVSLVFSGMTAILLVFLPRRFSPYILMQMHLMICPVLYTILRVVCC